MKTTKKHEIMGEVFRKLSLNENLTQQEAQTAAYRIFTALSNGEQDNFVLTTAFFGALTIKNPCIEELIGTAKAMEQTKTVDFQFKVNKPVVTAGGTGGDTLHTINITTPAIITAASAGAYAVKSGSKSFSSKTGCIDVVEALGVRVHLSPSEVEECVNRIGTVIWASEGVYPWMHALIGVGLRSSTKQLLPLLYSLRLVIATALNPFSLKRQVRGVSEPFTELVANVLGACGYERAFVVLGYGETERVRIDEFSTLGRNVVSELKTNGDVETFDVYPEDVGVKRGKLSELVAKKSHKANAEVVKRVLSGKDVGSCRDIILLNAASILVLAEVCRDLCDGYELAKQVVADGRAFAKFEQLAQFSNNNQCKGLSYFENGGKESV
ncbi:MAG: hypothetical protein LBE70_04135 [Nitrososphaerota archaeon]|jgi:anthranilate phosphoribosyltransferase|nr:hypothetical protein [Nitrososphaerota archaeon]